MTEEIDQSIDVGLSMCRGVIQRYIAYVQGVAPEQLFGEVQPTNEILFADKAKKYWALKLDIVDDPYYKFPLERCPGTAVVETMNKIAHALPFVYKMVLATEVREVARPELLMDSNLVMTPLTSFFIYNVAHGRELHDTFSKRIAFVWVEVAHPDDFTGPKGAKAMTDIEISNLISQINLGRCRICGAATCECL